MASNNIEIELKFPLHNSKEVINFLNINANLQAKDVFQKDTYFIPQHRNFLEVTYPYEWLRLRESNKGFFINYKHFFPENVEKTDYCDEFETKIDNPEVIHKIFSHLNIEKAVVVEKNRSTWLFEEVEIAVDEVEGLGTFIELEATQNFADPKEGKEYLFKVLEKLNAQTGETDLRGYPFLLLEKKK